MENNNNLQKPKEELAKEKPPNPELPERETRSYLVAREPSYDRRYRPRPETQKCLLPYYNAESPEESFSESTIKPVEEAPCTSKEASFETGPQVYLRLRPVDRRSTSYSISEDGNVLITTSKANALTSSNANRMEKHFGFTAIFDSSVDQRQVYETCVGPKISEEECVTIMTYGTSGSGKTFTLFGNDQSAGIIPRALSDIFTIHKNSVYSSPKMKLVNGCVIFLQDDESLMELQIRKKLLELCPKIVQGLQEKIEEEHAFSTCDSEEAVMIWVSFVEIYNEFVYDLLEVPQKSTSKVVQEAPRKNLKIVWNKGQVFVQGLTSVFVRSSEEALRLLRLGEQRSTSAQTAVNSNSSRSHRVFTVDMIKYNSSGITTQSSFKFCDLAGSERVNSTGTTGQRLKEAKNINTSLMVLGRCLDAASAGQRKKTVDVIPYRDSKLTMLLQAALLGKEKLAMIVTVSPVDAYYEENLNVLNFASIAKNIVFKEPQIKQHRSSYAGALKFSKMATDNKDSEYIKELEEKNVNLQLKLEHMEYLFTVQHKLLVDNENDFKQELRIRDKAELKLSCQRRRLEAEIKYLRDEIERLRNPMAVMETSQETESESPSVIEIADDVE